MTCPSRRDRPERGRCSDERRAYDTEGENAGGAALQGVAGRAERGADGRRKLHAFNLLPPDEEEQAQRLLLELLGKTGRDPWINAPFHCDYGSNIEVGDNFFANYNLTILDVGKVTIGSNVQFAPNVSIYTAGHPLHPDSRNSGYEYGLPVTIGDNVWIGGNVVLLPGVTVGSNSVIGAGSVVSRDIPEWVVAVGSPCRVVRRITEEDRKYYCKDRVFDEEDY